MRTVQDRRLGSSRQAKPDPEAVAISALAFLSRDDERLQRFVAMTGIDPSRLRDQIKDPGFLPAVLDHVVSDEALLIAFAAEAGFRPEDVGEAHRRWTATDSWP